jgi:hypothetical protein
VVQTQLHSVPPFATSFGLCLVTAYISDKIQLRYPFVILGYAILITGLAILRTVHGKAHFSAEYAGVCLVSMGTFCAGASIVCWYVMNLQGHVQRSIGSAWMIGFGNTGGIISLPKAGCPILSGRILGHHIDYSCWSGCLLGLRRIGLEREAAGCSAFG